MQGVSENSLSGCFCYASEIFLSHVDFQENVDRIKNDMKRRSAKGKAARYVEAWIPFLHVWVLKKRARERKLSTSAFLESLVRQYFRANDPRSAGPMEDLIQNPAPCAAGHRKDLRRVKIHFFLGPELHDDILRVVKLAGRSTDKGRLFSRFFRMVIEDALLKGRISPTGRIRLPEGYEVRPC